MFKHAFCSQYQWFDSQIKQIKNDKSRDQRDKCENIWIILQHSTNWSVISAVGHFIYSIEML